MLRKLLGALLGLCLSGTAALAVPIFDGTIVFTAAAGNCASTGQSFSAIYRPQIAASDQNSGLIIGLYRSGVGFARTNDGQFSGAGSFAGVILTAVATTINRVGSFNVTQSPATVALGTQFVTLTANFTPTVGCKYVFKGSFVRRPGT